MQKNGILNRENGPLIINELQIEKSSISILSIFPHVFSAFLGVFMLFSCANNHTPDELRVAEDLLWSEPDSCLSFLDELDYPAMSEHDSLACALMRAHALYKVYQLDDDSMLLVLKDYFEAHEDHRYAGEACYIIGRLLNDKQNLPMATFYLKAAEEHLLKAKDVPAQLLGMVYYGLGSSAEYERLFEIAHEYYRRALPYFVESNDSLYISCAYRDIARSSTIDDNIAILFLDSAEIFLPSTANEQYRLELNLRKNFVGLHDDSTDNILLYQTLCDSLGNYQYAAILCEYYLENCELDKASYYLSLLENDTANSTWSKEHFMLNQARLMHVKGRKNEAFYLLQDLHLWQTEEIESSAYTRSYMVEQRYDAERERADRLLAEAGKRRAYLVILIIAVSALFITALLLLLLRQERIRKRQKEELHLAELEKIRMEHEYRQQQLTLKNENLRQMLLLRQEHLQQQLHMRLKISAELKKQHLSAQHFSEADYNKIISKVVFLTPEKFSQLLLDFDIAYAGLLADLTQQYSLTGIERLYVVLIILGCSTAEISELACVSYHSASNQKLRLRAHLAIDGDIEEWLQNEANAYLREFFKKSADALT